jgi:hypothetical protein
VGVGALGLGSSVAATNNWIDPEGLVVGVEVGVGVGFGTSPPPPAGVRTTIDTVLELVTDDAEGDGVLFGRPPAAVLNGLTLEDDDAGGWSSVRNFSRMLLASLGEIVVVVVVLMGVANTVTVTVVGSSSPSLSSSGVPVLFPGLDPDNGVGEGEEEISSEPVMPPSTPEDSIRRRTLLSVVQSSCVPGARTSGMAKHSWVRRQAPCDVSNLPFTHVAMSPSIQAVS